MLSNYLIFVETDLFCNLYSGFASATIPMYIAESAPSHLRGQLVSLNNMFIAGGQLVAGIVAGLFSRDLVNGWRWELKCLVYIFLDAYSFLKSNFSNRVND